MNKKLETKRLFIYLALSFGMAYAVYFAFILTGHKWDGTYPRLESLAGLGMLTPVLAHVLTRWITKEGFPMTGKDSMMLGISFKNKKWRYYLFAMFIPWIYFELGYGFLLLVFPQAYDCNPAYLNELGMDLKFVYVLPLMMIVNGTMISFAAFGEEGGWRGYMMPKLISLLGRKKAVLIGGIIWGLWHAPLTCVGHNFGTDYPGFPYVGILLMCIDCIFMGSILTFVTEKTGSIWPAAILHAVNNTNPGILKVFVNTEKIPEFFGTNLGGWIFLLAPGIVIGSICLMFMCRKEKEEAA